MAFAPQEIRLELVVRIAGTCYTGESCFEPSKSEVMSPRWTGEFRHLILVIVALTGLRLRRGSDTVETLKKNSLAPRSQSNLLHSGVTRT
jgi:hypothetical protein